MSSGPGQVAPSVAWSSLRPLLTVGDDHRLLRAVKRDECRELLCSPDRRRGRSSFRPTGRESDSEARVRGSPPRPEVAGVVELLNGVGAPAVVRLVTTSREPPLSRREKVLRFRVRSGLDVPFTRLSAIVVEVGVVADAGAYATLIEIVRFGEGVGNARHIIWHVNPSKRQVTSLAADKAEAFLREAPFRARYSRSRLRVGGRLMELVEFEHPIQDGPFVRLEAKADQQVVPPAWVAEDVTHDPSTETLQVVLDACHNCCVRGS